REGVVSGGGILVATGVEEEGVGSGGGVVGATGVVDEGGPAGGGVAGANGVVAEGVESERGIGGAVAGRRAGLGGSRARARKRDYPNQRHEETNGSGRCFQSLPCEHHFFQAP